MCLRRAPEKYIAGAALDRAALRCPQFRNCPKAQVKVKAKVILRPTVSRPSCLGVRYPPATRYQFFLLLIIFSFRIVDMGSSL
jgi:hypothetical protein